MRLQHDWTIAPDIPARRVAAGVFLAQGRRFGLFAFSIPDNHAHAGVLCDRDAAGRFAWAVQVALHKRLGLEVPFEPARFTEIVDQRHLRSCLNYILGNAAKHGAGGDPCREGSNLPDLVELRPLGRYTFTQVCEALPRTRRDDLVAHLGVKALRVGTDVRLLVEAAAAALALPNLSGSRPRAVLGRRAAVRVGSDLGLTTGQLAAELGVSQRTVLTLLAQKPHPLVVRAIGLQIGLREQLAPVSPSARREQLGSANRRRL